MLNNESRSTFHTPQVFLWHQAKPLSCSDLNESSKMFSFQFSSQREQTLIKGPKFTHIWCFFFHQAAHLFLLFDHILERWFYLIAETKNWTAKNKNKVNFTAVFEWKAGNHPSKRAVSGEKGEVAKEGIHDLLTRTLISKSNFPNPLFSQLCLQVLQSSKSYKTNLFLFLQDLINDIKWLTEQSGLTKIASPIGTEFSNSSK